jgi:hypothetical protein
MKPDQLTALGQTVHPLIDHAENLLVVVSGVRESLLKAIDDNTIPEAVADRLNHKQPIVINRIKRADARRILEDRLVHFLKPFEALAEVNRCFKEDALFPLGTQWFDGCEPQSIEVRPRDVLSWANDRWREIKKAIEQQGQDWISKWPGSGDKGPLVVDPVVVGSEEITRAIDQKVSDKIEESVNGRRLQRGSLPADASNMMGLTKILLEQCLGHAEYTLKSVAARGKQQVDLVVEEVRACDQRTMQNHVQFCVTGSKVSAAFQLRKLLDSEGADVRVLVTDHDRFPLQLGQRGQEYLAALESRGKAFVQVQLSFEEYAQLDALQAVVGQARSGDLEIEPQPRQIIPVAEPEVVESHHRQGRYLGNRLLQLFLTEMPVVEPPPPVADKHFPPKTKFREFILAQLALQMGSRLIELLDKFIANGHHAHAREQCLENAKQIILEMHAERAVSATPWDQDYYLVLLGKQA